VPWAPPSWEGESREPAERRPDPRPARTEGLPGSYLVDPASSHMLVSKIKPCRPSKLTRLVDAAVFRTRELLISLMITN
jgi:hypothetical protein